MIYFAVTAAVSAVTPHKYATSLLSPQSTITYLHVFADISFKAYGAIAYIQLDQGVPSLVMSSNST